jgi:RHS repeat-associated protein
MGRLPGGQEIPFTVERRISRYLFVFFAPADFTDKILEVSMYDASGRQRVFARDAIGVVDFGDDHVGVEGGTIGAGKPCLFTGQQLDSETGLYYYKNRFFNPVQGRYLSRESRDDEPVGNLYSYVDDEPTVMLDPTGLLTVTTAHSYGNRTGDGQLADIIFYEDYRFKLEKDASVGVWQDGTLKLQCWDKDSKLIIDILFKWSEFFPKDGLVDKHSLKFANLAEAETGSTEDWKSDTSKICKCVITLDVYAYEVTGTQKDGKDADTPKKWRYYNTNQTVTKGNTITDFDLKTDQKMTGVKTPDTTTMSEHEERTWKNKNCCSDTEKPGTAITGGSQDYK